MVYILAGKPACRLGPIGILVTGYLGLGDSEELVMTRSGKSTFQWICELTVFHYIHTLYTLWTANNAEKLYLLLNSRSIQMGVT